MVDTVKDYFRNSPFLTFAGKLALETGHEDFAKLKLHSQLQKEIEEHFRARPITIRILAGNMGGGKTWTLSWLYRSFKESEDTLVIGIPRLELRGLPERGLLEALFRGIKPEMTALLRKMSKSTFPPNLRGTNTEYVWEAISDPDAFSILSGIGGKLPVLKGIAPPPLTKTEGTMDLFLALFRTLRIVGYIRILVLIDEVESLFSAYGKTNLFIFSNYVRGIFDEFESDDGRSLPRLVMLLSGTYGVLQELSPGFVGRQMDASDTAQALVRRLAPPFLLDITDKADALEIAEFRIGKHRKISEAKPYIPYDEKAIEYVWEHNLGNLGNFCRDLQQMYEIALKKKATRITIDHAKEAVALFQSTEEVSAAGR